MGEAGRNAQLVTAPQDALQGVQLALSTQEDSPNGIKIIPLYYYLSTIPFLLLYHSIFGTFPSFCCVIPI